MVRTIKNLNRNVQVETSLSMNFLDSVLIREQLLAGRRNLEKAFIEDDLRRVLAKTSMLMELLMFNKVSGIYRALPFTVHTKADAFQPLIRILGLYKENPLPNKTPRYQKWADKFIEQHRGEGVADILRAERDLGYDIVVSFTPADLRFLTSELVENRVIDIATILRNDIILEEVELLASNSIPAFLYNYIDSTTEVLNLKTLLKDPFELRDSAKQSLTKKGVGDKKQWCFWVALLFCVHFFPDAVLALKEYNKMFRNTLCLNSALYGAELYQNSYGLLLRGFPAIFEAYSRINAKKANPTEDFEYPTKLLEV